MFFAATKTRLDYLWDSFLPWQRSEATWEPLCSHNPLMERPKGNVELTEEQLIDFRKEQLKRAAFLFRTGPKTWEMNQRTKYPDAWKERGRLKAKKYREQYGDRVRKMFNVYRKKIKNSQQYMCHVCEVACVSAVDLETHLIKARYIKKVAGLVA